MKRCAASAYLSQPTVYSRACSQHSEQQGNLIMPTVAVKWGALERTVVQRGGLAVIGALDDPCRLDLRSD